MKIERWFRKRIVLPLCAAVVLGLGLSRSSFSSARNVVKEAANDKAADKHTATVLAQLAGTPSCSARGCHGAIEPVLEPGKCRQNEYTLWVRDPHADAYQVLLEPRSQEIARLLGTKAHEDVRCLACHTNPQVAGLPASPFVREEQTFGVGCESCHGAANSWLAAHTAPDWRKKKSTYDMRDLSDLVVQAKTCAGCHVGAPAENGAPARDVNHDLIAAGHPRLNFEFGAFHANMPPHWRPKETAEGQLWAIGQVASAEAALTLLVYRTGVDNEGAAKPPWPEFAEYDCYACHHALAQPSWRQDAKSHGRRLGALPWGSWYYALLRPLGADLPALHGKQGLAALMERPLPPRKEAAAKAEAARAEAQRILDHLAKAPKNQDDQTLDRARLQALLEDVGKTGIPSWDSAEQFYLALHALNQSHPRADVTRALKELTPLRVFPPDFTSPASWPQNKEFPFDPKKFAEKLLPITK